MADSDAAGPSSKGPQHEDTSSELIKKTPVQVIWMPETADTTDLSALPPVPFDITLSLRARYDVPVRQASFQLQLRNVALANETTKKTFHLHIPPERIESLTLTGVESPTLPKSETVYRLTMKLKAPLDLIGPQSHSCEKGWLGIEEHNNKLKQLRSLAEALHLTLLLPTAAVKKSPLLEFCEAVSMRGLRSLPSLYDIESLYGGSGGYVYVPPQLRAPISSQDVPGDAPGWRSRCQDPESPAAADLAPDRSTVSVDTPPGYREPPPPEYSDKDQPKQQQLQQNNGKRPARHGSEDSDLNPPPKRRNCDAPEKRGPAGDADQDTIDMLMRAPRLQQLFRLLEAQSQKTDQLTDELDKMRKSHAELEAQMAAQTAAHKQGVEQLTAELDKLRKSHDDLETQMATQTHKMQHLTGDWDKLRETNEEVEAQLGNADDRLEETEKTVESLEGRVYALEEDYEDIGMQMPSIRCEVEDAVRDIVGDVMRELVDDMVQDSLEDHAVVSRLRVKALIEERVEQAVRDHFQMFHMRFNRALQQ